MPKCPVCAIIEEVCDTLGDKNYCEKKLVEFARGNEEAVEEIFRKFGREKFLDELNKEIDRRKQ